MRPVHLTENPWRLRGEKWKTGRRWSWSFAAEYIRNRMQYQADRLGGDGNTRYSGGLYGQSIRSVLRETDKLKW